MAVESKAKVEVMKEEILTSSVLHEFKFFLSNLFQDIRGQMKKNNKNFAETVNGNGHGQEIRQVSTLSNDDIPKTIYKTILDVFSWEEGEEVFQTTLYPSSFNTSKYPWNGILGA